jgi:hypothetical protein
VGMTNGNGGASGSDEADGLDGERHKRKAPAETGARKETAMEKSIALVVQHPSAKAHVMTTPEYFASIGQVEAAVIPEASEESIDRAWLWMCEEKAALLMKEWNSGDLTYFDRWLLDWDEAGVLVPLGMQNLDAWRHARRVLKRAHACNGE